MEGGGQLLRSVVSLSSLLKKRIRITKIRGGRSKPGLKAQHLAGLHLVKAMTPSSSMSGDSLHSETIAIEYSKGDQGNHVSAFTADAKTAGSICLVAQVALPLAIFRPKVTITALGGTDAQMAPTIAYYQYVFMPNIRRFGVELDIDVHCKGYFPRGGGKVCFTVHPVTSSLQPIILEDRGEIVQIDIYASVAGNIPFGNAQAMTEAAYHIIRTKLPNIHANFHTYKEPNSVGHGSSILITATTSNGCVLGGSAIGSPKVMPQKTGCDAAEDLCKSLLHPFATVDSYMCDQLIIYMALSSGTSRIVTGPLSLHTKTGIYVAEKLTACKFHVVENDQKSIIECSGIAFSPR